MKRNLQFATMLLTLLFAVRLRAQDGEPQLEEFHQRARAEAKLDQAFFDMYDLEFGKANAALERFVAENPDDPRGPAAQAASVLFSIFNQHRILQAEFFTSDNPYVKRQALVPDVGDLKRFESALDRSEILAQQELRHNHSDGDALFALALAYGLRADYAALIEHRDFAALRFSDMGNGWARKLLAVSPQTYDAYVATGIQKYLVSLKPAPMRWMLRVGGIKGNQNEGVRELELAAEKGRYLAPFARILLAVAHLRKHESAQALTLLAGLREQFPHNPLFVEEIARLQEKTRGPSLEQTSGLSVRPVVKGQ